MSQVLTPSLGLSSVVDPISHQNQQQQQQSAPQIENSPQEIQDQNMSDINNNNTEEDNKNGENEEKKFSCPHCDHKFTRKHNLKSHLLIHTKEKPFSCSICSSKFRRLHDLKRHEKLHTGEKPYQCKSCGRKFARCDALVRHNNSQSGCTLLVDDAILKSRIEEHDAGVDSTPQRSRASSISSQVSTPNVSLANNSLQKSKHQSFETGQWRLNNQLPPINRLQPLINPISEEELKNASKTTAISTTDTPTTSTTPTPIDDDTRKNNYDLLPYVKLLESRVATLETKLSATETKLAQLTYSVHNTNNQQQHHGYNAHHDS